MRSARARAGDALVLTKPLGIGVLTHGVKQGKTSPAELAAAIDQMTMLNMEASRAGRSFGASAMTDVTGFGLVVHTLELARASGLDVELDSSAVPVLPGARRVAAEGCMPGAVKSNREFAAGNVTYGDKVDETAQCLLNDPQTSGGLLVATDERSARKLAGKSSDKGIAAAVVGRTAPMAGQTSVITIR